MDGSVPAYPPQLTVHYWAFITLVEKSLFPSHCHFDSLVLTSFTTLFYLLQHHIACGILVTQPRIEPMPLQWKLEVLTTELPGNSFNLLYFSPHCLHWCIFLLMIK